MALRWDVSDAARLAQLLDHPPVAGLHISGGAARVRSHRDVYCDTADGDLRQRGARYRVRFTADGKRHLTVWLPDGGGTRVTGVEAETRVRAVVDPARLAPWIELDVTRRWRVIEAPLVRLPLSDLIGDTITARRRDVQGTFWELGLEPRGWPGAGLAARALGRRLEATLQLRRVGDDALQRAHAALDDAEGQLVARELRGERELALVAVEHGRLGLCRLGAELRIPVDKGSGETACRDALRRLVGNGEGQLRLLGVVPAAGERAALEVWTVRRVHANSVLQWFSPAELLARVGSPLLRDRATLAALTLAARSPIVPEWSGMAFGDGTGADDSAPESVERQSRVTLSELRTPVLSAEQVDPARAQPEQFLNPELSWLEFNARVLALAEDSRTPPAARVRFLGIFSTNLDDFVAAKVAALRHLVARAGSSPSGDGLRPQQTLDALAIRLRPLITRQYRLFDALVRNQGSDAPLVMTYWAELTAAEQAELRARFTDTVLPFLSPKALTRAPGHPFPVIGERRIVLLVVLRDRAGAPPHYGLVEIPETLPRFEYLPDGRRILPIEELVRANLDLLYPGRLIMAAHAFRVTRSGELQLDESAAANFLQAIEDELVRRVGPIVRIEIEPATPEPLRNLLQRELHFEESEREGGLDPPDVYIAGGPVDLGALRDLPTRLGDYRPFAARDAFAPNRPLARQVDERDVLVHHPHDSFTSSFERFIVEAADDPDVQSIKLTLYRPGSGGGASPIADALRRAAAGGKDVAVIVELKARFDEARNIAWARSLERDGIHVVTGLVSLKTHAKLALVVARQSGGGNARRYAHIGTGNYNPDTARVYTDVGLFTADPRITTDVHALFNDLTGSTQPPQGGLPHLLVSPADLLDRVLGLIDRETRQALAGRPAQIRAKINGLADSTITQALYRASQAGVDVDLSVRGICTLRPGVPGLSERIRVTSVLGRFLEHARIYHFANGGEGEEYYIGSADWRPRNLRRRVEVMAPVFDAAVRGKLDAILTAELEGSAGSQDEKRRWILTSDGRYEPT